MNREASMLSPCYVIQKYAESKNMRPVWDRPVEARDGYRRNWTIYWRCTVSLNGMPFIGKSPIAKRSRDVAAFLCLSRVAPELEFYFEWNKGEQELNRSVGALPSSRVLQGVRRVQLHPIQEVSDQVVSNVVGDKRRVEEMQLPNRSESLTEPNEDSHAQPQSFLAEIFDAIYKVADSVEQVLIPLEFTRDQHVPAANEEIQREEKDEEKDNGSVGALPNSRALPDVRMVQLHPPSIAECTSPSSMPDSRVADPNETIESEKKSCDHDTAFQTAIAQSSGVLKLCEKCNVALVARVCFRCEEEVKTEEERRIVEKRRERAARYPVMQFRAGSISEELEEFMICSLCREIMETPVKNNCNHTHCLKCTLRWIDTCGKHEEEERDSQEDEFDDMGGQLILTRPVLTARSTVATVKKEGEYSCPMCRTVCYEECLGVDYALLRLVNGNEERVEEDLKLKEEDVIVDNPIKGQREIERNEEIRREEGEKEPNGSDGALPNLRVLMDPLTRQLPLAHIPPAAPSECILSEVIDVIEEVNEKVVQVMATQQSPSDPWEINSNELIKLDDKRLGSGSFGLTTCQQYRGVRVAVKCLRTAASRRDFEREVKVLKKTDHPNIVKMIGVCTSGDSPILILELMERKGLLQYFKAMKENGEKLPRRCSHSWLVQIACAMNYLSENRVIHRDLAARNILVGENSIEGFPIVKVADFGLSEEMDKNGTFFNMTGGEQGELFSWRHAAPETKRLKIYSEKSDIWSFAITVFEIYSLGETPYSEMKSEKVIQMICKKIIIPPHPMVPSQVYNEIMRPCLRFDPSLRPSFLELCNILRTMN